MFSDVMMASRLHLLYLFLTGNNYELRLKKRSSVKEKIVSIPGKRPVYIVYYAWKIGVFM